MTTSIDAPSTRFRVLTNFPEFKNRNFNLTIKEIPKDISSRLRLISSLSSYDIVFLQKKLFQWWILWYIRQKSKVLIYDFDDAVLFRDSNTQKYYSFSRQRRFKRTLKYADFVISGNEYLKELSLPFAKRVFVIPTGIDTQTYTPKPSPDNSHCITIGWIGSKPNLIYLKQLIKPINKLYAKKENFRLKIVCDGFIDGFDCPVEKKVWKEEDAVKDIQSFDIGVMPLVDDRWTRGKCAFKLLQYMSCGIASVSSSTDVTSNMVKDGINGFLASSDSQWLEKIKFLIENPDKRKCMGKEARKSLAGSFDTKSIALQYVTIFENAYTYS
ncbi:MAG: glycosyltransferase family 4 protein [Planctomycetota bacterium]